MTLNEYRIEQGWTFAQLAKTLSMEREAARRRCLPPRDPLSRVPDRTEMARIWLMSAGRVPPSAFYDLPALPKQRAA